MNSDYRARLKMDGRHFGQLALHPRRRDHLSIELKFSRDRGLTQLVEEGNRFSISFDQPDLATQMHITSTGYGPNVFLRTVCLPSHSVKHCPAPENGGRVHREKRRSALCAMPYRRPSESGYPFPSEAAKHFASGAEQQNALS